MPRRHIRSAAGALAATLYLVAMPSAGAQDTGPEPLRPIPQEGWEAVVAPVATVEPPIEVGVGEGDVTTSDTPPETEGLGGMGDVPPEVAFPRLGGLGDELSELEEEEIVLPEDALGLTPAIRAPFATPQIHSALLPEAHNLDPFVPVGIRIGNFLIFPEAEIGADMTNNVLTSPANPQFDMGPEVTPKVRVDSDWARHALSFEANADYIWYSEFPIADVKNWQLLSRGRLDVTRRTRLYGEIGKSQVQEGASAISITDIPAAGVSKVDEQHALAAFEHTFNRLTVKLTGTVADFDYTDTGNTTLSGPVPFVDIADYTETEGTLRSTYEFNSTWAGFIETSLNERDYREPLTVQGFRRGSTGWTTLAGVNLRLWGSVFGEIGAGWGEQQPIDDNFAVISGPLVNGNLIWLPNPSTKVEFIASSDISETTLDNSAGAVSHYFQLGLQQAFWRYLVLGVYGSYERADYAGVPQVDQRTKLGATAEYYFNPLLSAYARFEHTDFTSSPDSSGDFLEDELKIGLKFRR